MSRWGRGRGKLGFLTPLFGDWVAEGGSGEGAYRVIRSFSRALEGSHLRLEARWELGERTYEELALFGRDREGVVRFWSFTSDGRQATGWLAEAPDIPAGGFAFEADMPAGRARMAYWPLESGEGFGHAVESRSKQGWNRFLEHEYRPLNDRPA